MNKTKNFSAFTLVELMITVAIIGLLAMVASSQYRQYIFKTISSEGILKLKSLYEGQVLFYAQQPFLSSDKKTSCELTHKLTPVSSFKTDIEDCSSPPNGQSFKPPKGKKQHACLFGMKLSGLFVVNGFGGESCVQQNNYQNYGTYETIGGDNHNYSYAGTTFTNIGTVRFTESPGYFLVQARPDANIASEYGVTIDKTIALMAFADTDGDYTGPSNSRPDLASPLESSNIWTMLRGVYLNDENELVGTPGIYQVNIGE